MSSGDPADRGDAVPDTGQLGEIGAGVQLTA
jgi:hypothetical protein